MTIVLLLLKGILNYRIFLENIKIFEFLSDFVINQLP